MNFDLTEDEKRFQSELCDFLDGEITREIAEESDSGLGLGPYSWELMRKLGAKRWLAPSYPVEYGGLGLSRIYRYIVQRELDYRNALAFIKCLGLIGVDIAGPTILRHGSKELKEEFLPRIAAGEIEFALGYSEPDAGSDLSRLRIRAVEDGDSYIITGQKIYQSHSHFAQYHWLVARTDVDVPRHKGISMFVVDLKTPGITIEPLWEMSGIRTNQVFYEEVRVPKKYLVGEKNRGWYYVASALDLERTVSVGYLESVVEKIIDYIKNTSRNGTPLGNNPIVRQRIADIIIEIHVVRNLIRRVAWLQDKGIVPNSEASQAKLFTGELFQHIAQAGLDIMGLDGLVRKDSKRAMLGGLMESFFRSSFLPSIGGGTSEIMRNIIAVRGLGLPLQ
jgi:hypothetical protein